MRVTINGVKGYEYQYKVTVLIALLCRSNNAKLYVEKIGSEDALLVIESNGISQKIEIQVKRENDNIDIGKLVSWLCHFSERKGENNLLNRLVGKECLVLFATHSRCTDAIVKLKTNLGNFEKHQSVLITDDWYNEFLKALKNQFFGNTKLMVKRKTYCQNQANSFKSKDDIIQAIERCLILEMLTDDIVDNHITTLLNSAYQIAQSRTATVYLELLEKVKFCRDTGEDVYISICNHINHCKIGNPNITSTYKTRCEEKSLTEALEKEGILLLTGISQCGKTELAKKIAERFCEKGFEFRIYDDISELKRFFNVNISDNKIGILEDPFGHIKLNEDYVDILHKINDLVANLNKHHFLIMSSRIEILYEVFGSDNLNDCRINKHLWVDLTIKDKSIINLYWTYLSGINSLPVDIIEVVSDGILTSREEDLLQIGQLTYLVNEKVDNIANKNFIALEHIARSNSKEIAKQLKVSNEIAADMLSFISICSTPIQGVAFNELAYILSESSILVSTREDDFFSFSFNNPDPSIPSNYPKESCLSKEALNAINFLEERQFISVNRDTILLRHPNYYEAGRYLFINTGKIKLLNNIELYKKCIGCLNSKTAYLSSKNYAFIYENIKIDLRDNIISIGFLGLSSIFPSVVDNSFIFLINCMQQINGDQYSKLINKIQNGGISWSHIYWDNNTPFISNEGNYSNHFFDMDSEISKKVEADLSQNIQPNIYNAWLYINKLKNDELIPSNAIRILLQYNEVFVREKVVYLIFSRSYLINEYLIVELFNDEHPNIVFHTIRASILNWFKLQTEYKDLVKKFAIKCFEKEPVAIRTFNLMSTFSIDYGNESIVSWNELDSTQKKELWQLWG